MPSLPDEPPREARRRFKGWRVLVAVTLVACEPAPSITEYVEPTSKRTYEVIVPSGHDPKREAPVLFALHAYATSPETLPRSFSLAESAGQKRGFLVVVPRGTLDAQGNFFWNASRACCGDKEVDDLGYLQGVLGDLKRHFAVDSGRVYAIGISNGAFMAHRWACAGNDLRGIAAISGVGPGPQDPPCAPSGRVRVLQIHGDQDEIVSYDGGEGSRGRYPSVDRSTRAWSDVNGCRTERGPDTSYSLLHGRTSKVEWIGPDRCVLLWTFKDGGHRLRTVRYALSDILDFLDGGAAP